MAGSHQLWTLDLNALDTRVFAGSGHEGIVDGALKAASLAQPSGITAKDGKIYFVDSEASAVRKANIDQKGKVETLIGSGLFEFGDIDGPYSRARLQHPIGVAYHDGLIYVADTYNHKVKMINPETKEIVTLVGQGRSGLKDGQGVAALLNEPNGLAFANGKMYITDTNNHLIRIYDLASGIVTTLELHGIEKLVRSDNGDFRGDERKLPPVEISKSAARLQLDITLPPGTKFTENAPFKIAAMSNGLDVVRIGNSSVEKQSEVISIPIIAHPGVANITIDMNLYYCSGDNRGQCFFKEARLTIPVKVTDSSNSILSVRYVIPN